MKEFTGKCVVITGAASGIGYALAERFAREGMRVLLADIDSVRLDRAVAALRAAGADARGVAANVERQEDVERIAAGARDAFGTVDVVCLNAGVASPTSPAWLKPLEDWRLVLGVNLWGVIHGVRTFVPILLGQGTESHVLITASAAGLIAAPFGADYLASKHAVVSIAESLRLELAEAGGRVKVSVLCPGFVRTGILDAVENRSRGRVESAEMARISREHRRMLGESTPPQEIAEAVLGAIREGRFWILPHEDMKAVIEARLLEIVRGP